MRRSLLLVLAALLVSLWPASGRAASPQQEAPPAAPPGFVRAVGGQLVVGDQPITLRGVNYYPQGKPWADMWQWWDGPQIERELRQARDELGINVVRILVPYGWADWDKTVNKQQMNQLHQLTSIAGRLQLRLILTLFDFSDEFEGPTSRATDRQLRYLKTIVGGLADDQRILAWDVHNEPDHYDSWKRGDAQAVLAWLAMMADEIRALDRNHLVTVGMGQYDNLWQPGPDGRRVVDISDFASIHIYNAPDAARQLDELRSYTDKPIVLEEFGWPTGPECGVLGFDEAAQAETYRQVMEAAQSRVAGMVAWTLRDYDPGPTLRWDSNQEHYGLYRPDGSLKPAADRFRTSPVQALPSDGPTDTQLTAVPYEPRDGGQGAIFVPESGRHIKGQFRKAWELLNGARSFGLPLSEPFVRQEDNIVVQYFNGSVIEYHPEAERAPDWPTLTSEQKLQRLLLPLSIGVYHAQQRGFGPGPFTIEGEFARFYNENYGPWRFGQPLSPEVTEPVDGQDTLVQYFERGRLEWDAATGQVRVGALGADAWGHQCRITGWR